MAYFYIVLIIKYKKGAKGGINQAERQGIQVVIPPKRNRKVQRAYDRNLYKIRHLVENTFLHLKRWRGIATRYAKNRPSAKESMP